MKRKSNFKIIYLILYCVFFVSLLYAFIIPYYSFCEEVQSITITKEDIINAKAKSPYVVNFDKSDLRAVTIMEKRHFTRTYPELSDLERLNNLEYELLGRKWEFTHQDLRLKRLKIASSNTMLIGTALPPSISSKRNVKRMMNNSIQLRQRDNVGLIDGFLRLISPEKYEMYRKNADRLYYKYEY